jgi:D-3-phosphoglycerate dehydrogenase
MKKNLLTNLLMLAEEECFVAIIEEKGFNVIVKRPPQFFEEDACLDIVEDIDGWLAGDDVVTAAVMDKVLPRLQVISKCGTGLDSIDLDAARALDLPVLNTPAAFQNAVAKVALSYMLELARNVVRSDRHICDGQWPKSPSLGLMGQSLGVIGFGAIGQGIAKRAAAFNMDINFYDPYFSGDA